MNKSLFFAFAFIIVAAVLFILLITDVLVFPFQGWVVGILLALGAAMMQLNGQEEEREELNKQIDHLSDDKVVELKKLRNFLYVMYANGKTEKEEVVLLATLFNGKLDESIIVKEINLFPTTNFSIYVPESEEALNVHLNQLVAMMIIDEKQNKTEKKRIKEIFHACGVEEDKIDSSINLIVATLENNDEFLNLRKACKSAK